MVQLTLVLVILGLAVLVLYRLGLEAVAPHGQGETERAGPPRRRR